MTTFTISSCLNGRRRDLETQGEHLLFCSAQKNSTLGRGRICKQELSREGLAEHTSLVQIAGRMRRWRGGMDLIPTFVHDKHPSPFWVFLALFGQKTPKRIGMTSLGFTGTTGMTSLGNPVKMPKNCPTNAHKMLVIPVRFGVFWPENIKKTRNGLG